MGKKIKKLQRRKSKAKQRARKKYHTEEAKSPGEVVSSASFDTYSE